MALVAVETGCFLVSFVNFRISESQALMGHSLMNRADTAYVDGPSSLCSQGSVSHHEGGPHPKKSVMLGEMAGDKAPPRSTRRSGWNGMERNMASNGTEYGMQYLTDGTFVLL